MEAVLARSSDIMAAVERLEDSPKDARVRVWTAPVSAEEQQRIRKASAAESSQATDSPMLLLVNMLIAKGLEQRASEVQFEPFEQEAIVRYWRDGTVVGDIDVPGVLLPSIVNVIKIMGQLRIDKNEPQEGRILWGGDIELRVYTRPSAEGESLTLHITK